MGDCENCVFAAGLLVSGDGGGWKRQGDGDDGAMGLTWRFPEIGREEGVSLLFAVLKSVLRKGEAGRGLVACP